MERRRRGAVDRTAVGDGAAGARSDGLGRDDDSEPEIEPEIETETEIPGVEAPEVEVDG